MKEVSIGDMIKEIMRKRGLKSRRDLAKYLKKKYGFDPRYADFDTVFTIIIMEYSELE